MDFDLYFCTDGILRAKLNDDKPMIPVKFLQDNGSHKGNDFRFWARWWECNTYFEEGLTVGKFLSCLEPWGEFWSDFTGKDIISYIKESRRPIVISKEEKKEDEKPLSWISITYHTDLSPISEYSDDDDIKDILDDINGWFNKPKNTRLTGEWEINSSYKVSGFVEGKEEQYSIDYFPMNKLANIPIVLSDKHILYFSNWKLNQILGEDKDHFFQNNAFGLCSTKEGFTRFVIGNKIHNIKDIIEGFFWWFHSNPSSRNEFIETILERKEAIDEALDASLDKENEVLQSNVINLFDKKSESINTESKSKNMKVNIANNAFSPIIMSIERDKVYWEEMLEKAYKNNNIVLKIGKVEKAKSPEKRIFSYIIKNDNDPANPKPSDYKLW
jgi:hypothetical protein